jgi:hypothetical protein
MFLFTSQLMIILPSKSRLTYGFAFPLKGEGVYIRLITLFTSKSRLFEKAMLSQSHAKYKPLAYTFGLTYGFAFPL